MSPQRLIPTPIKKAKFKHWLFMRNKSNKAAFAHMRDCECGTRGSCEECAPAADFLYNRWLAVCYPWHWLFKTRHHPILWLRHSLHSHH